MNIEAMGHLTTAPPRSSLPAEQVERSRKESRDMSQEVTSAKEQNNSQPEELLNQIKSLTEDGLYSVRFENNENEQLIVKVVDMETDEVIRQIPPEELLELTKLLQELQGNLVDTVG